MQTYLRNNKYFDSEGLFEQFGIGWYKIDVTYSRLIGNYKEGVITIMFREEKEYTIHQFMLTASAQTHNLESIQKIEQKGMQSCFPWSNLSEYEQEFLNNMNELITFLELVRN